MEICYVLGAAVRKSRARASAWDRSSQCFKWQPYRIVKPLGAGGFGKAYAAIPLDGDSSAPRLCCLKVTIDLTGWHGEAYFGHVLRNAPSVLRIHESFAWMRPGKAATPVYCLVTEFADGGDLEKYLGQHPNPWPEKKARAEIIRLLRKVVTVLHDIGVVHRDITPRNVFVMPNNVLKLGDFGIASQQIGKRAVPADIFAPFFAPTAIAESIGGQWHRADDVYQLGQIFAFLLKGCATRKLSTIDVKRLSCSAQSKAVIQRCIGKRSRRFLNARKMLEALQRQEIEPDRPVLVRSLAGKRVVFTGRLAIPRVEAARLVRRAGGIVQRRVSGQTDIVVRGKTSLLWKADTKGQKLLDVWREQERNHRIAEITERRFRALVGI